MICHICNSQRISKTLSVREMMLGLREEFEYFLCTDCGCLQISSIPQNIERYYPADYISFKHPLEPTNYVRKWFSRKRFTYMFFRHNLIGALIFFLFPSDVLPYGELLNLNFNMDILDVGYGDGFLLNLMAREGFKNLTGIDKFMNAPAKNGIKFIKGELNDLNGSLFDVIMFHHSLEHMPDQHSIFEQLKSLLKSDGKIIIRIPIIGYAFNLFRENWVQLDAPRHFYLHTVKSLQTLAERHGFSVDNIIFDSSYFQFTGSIKYSKDIPLIEPFTFSTREIAAYSNRARRLNKEHQGDSACFILSVTNPLSPLRRTRV
jgi:SAM-dependent methyltransferase